MFLYSEVYLSNPIFTYFNILYIFPNISFLTTSYYMSKQTIMVLHMLNLIFYNLRIYWVLSIWRFNHFGGCMCSCCFQTDLLCEKKKLGINNSKILVSFELKFYTKIWIDIMLKVATAAIRVDDFRISQPTFLYQYSHTLLC